MGRVGLAVLSLVPTRLVVISRNSIKRFAPHARIAILSVAEPLLGGPNRSPLSPSLLGELVSRSGHGAAGVVPSWFVCPSAYRPRHCCFWSAGADCRFELYRLAVNLL